MGITCGHFNFIVRDTWILCEDCDRGIQVDSSEGQRILNRKRGYERKLTPHQLAVWDGLVESYKELVKNAGTTDREKLANFANGCKGKIRDRANDINNEMQK